MNIKKIFGLRQFSLRKRTGARGTILPVFSNKNHRNGGFITIRNIIIVIIIISILSYFNFNVKSFVESDIVQDNFSYVWGYVVTVWDGYLRSPATYLYNDIFIELIWKPAVESLTMLRNRKMPLEAPQINFEQ